MKIFKRVLKITGIFLASLLLLLVSVVLVAKLFENDLASYAMDELESEINAPMSVGKVSVIPLFAFPRFSTEINDLWIGERGHDINDSLFYLSNLKVGFDTWDLINGKYTIDKMELSGLQFDYTINSKGQSNIDFLIYAFSDTTEFVDDVPSDSAQTPSTLFLTAEKGKITNITVKYFDTTTNTAANIHVPQIDFKAKTKNDIYEIDAEGSVVVSNCCYEDTRLDLMDSGTLDFTIKYNDGQLQLDKFEINSDGFRFGMSGTASIGDTLSMDLNMNADALDFTILKKYIPDDYAAYVPALNSGDVPPILLGLKVNYFDDEVLLKSMNLKTEGIDLALEGEFQMGDTISVDAGLEVKEIDYRIIKKFIPAQMLRDYGIVDLGGKMALSAEVSGKYADSTLMPGIVADVSLDKVQVVTRDYPEIKVLNFKSKITNVDLANPDNTTVNLSELEIFTPQSFVKLTGNFRGIENMKYDFGASMRISPGEFVEYIPDSIARNLKGKFSANLQTSGVLPDSITDAFIDKVLNQSSFDFQCENLSGLFMDSYSVNDFNTDVTYLPIGSKTKKLDIKNLALKAEEMNIALENSSAEMFITGQMSNLSDMKIDVKSLRLQQGLNLVSGAMTIENPENPEFEMNASVTLKLDELMPFVPDSLINNMAGNVNMFVRSHGNINPDKIEEEMYPALFENSRFDIACNNVTVSFPDSSLSFRDLSADLSFEKDLLTVTKLALNYNGLPVEVDSTIVKNIYKTILLNQEEQLYVNTHINLGDIDFQDFEYLMAMDSTEAGASNQSSDEQPADEEPQNWTFLIHGSAAVKSFSIDTTEFEGYMVNRLHLKDISTLFKLTDSAYIADQFKFKAFDGEINNSFNFRLREDGTQTVSSRHNVKGMDIQMLLRDLDNFGMDSLITWQNISGSLSTDLNMFFPIDDSLVIDKMMISGEIVLEDGGVFDYGPAQEMSGFTRIKELDNIQFKTLRSNIFMFKNRIWVPRTHIVSNALDIAAFGMFDMNYEYDYRLEIHLRDILFGKSKRRNKKQDAKGDEVDVRTLKKSSRKIRYADVDGETKMGLDSKESREEMMNKIRVQRKMLDFIFFPKNIHYSTDVPENM